MAAALGAPVPSSAPPAAQETVYSYTDAQGAPLFEVVRFIDRKSGDKRFYQRQPNGTKGRGGAPLVLYGLPEVLAAVAAGEMVYLVEGEKDVENLRLLGLTATCNPGGAGKSCSYAANEVVLLGENDRPVIAASTAVRYLGP